MQFSSSLAIYGPSYKSMVLTGGALKLRTRRVVLHVADYIFK